MENETQQNIPQTPPLTPLPTNWSKVLLFTILEFVVVAGSVFIGIQIGKNQTSNQQPIAVQPTASPTQTVANPTAIPAIDPTANWQSYSSSKHGFSFKYPLDYEIRVSPVTGNEYNIIVEQKANTNEAGFVPIQLSINVAKDENGNPLVMTSIKEAEAHYLKIFSSSSVTKKIL